MSLSVMLTNLHPLWHGAFAAAGLGLWLLAVRRVVRDQRRGGAIRPAVARARR